MIKIAKTQPCILAMHAHAKTVKHTKGLPVELETVKVAEGKLLVIKSTLDIEDNTIWIDDYDDIFINDIDNPFELVKKYTPVQPLLISETEKIEVGDWFLYDNKWILQATNNGATDKKIEKLKCSKILALPKHFSKDQIKRIAKGDFGHKVVPTSSLTDKIKQGDIVLIECATDYILEMMDENEADYKYIGYYIKLDKDNHIIIHPNGLGVIENENRYTKEQLEDAFYAGRETMTRYSIGDDDGYEIGKWHDFDHWFNSKIKKVKRKQ